MVRRRRGTEHNIWKGGRKRKSRWSGSGLGETERKEWGGREGEGGSAAANFSFCSGIVSIYCLHSAYVIVYFDACMYTYMCGCVS